ncbi:MAG: peptidase, partial [Frankiales bacterium]|nr:peptidase [Frankiales bacterium]
MFALGALAFVLALLTSVTLHEAGHFLTARRFGMKATQFFAGFGPTVYSWRRGETEYGLKAIPLGGYVKIIGMTPLEEIEAGDEDRAFFRQKPWQKFVVLVAGSTMHFIIATVLVFIAVVSIGVSEPNAPVLMQPTSCVFKELTAKQIDDPKAKLDATPVNGVCPANTVAGAAKAAGLQKGDYVQSVDGNKISTYEDLVTVIRADTSAKPLAVVVKRGDATKTLTITPFVTSRPRIDDKTKQISVGT